LGLAGTGLILAQAGLLARLLAGAATGTGLAALAGSLIALALVLAGRAAISYGGETAALRAATVVKSQLRRRLIDGLLRRNPEITAPGQADGELATLATRGLDGLDAYFARYLPQLVLAVLVPLAVLIRVALADWLSALIIAVTLPLVPVFAVLVGLSTRARTRRQWALLAWLGGHFLDVVEGLPTLRVFGRARVQETTIADMTDRYRGATMATLRVAFLSALVLELAATIATALVAVEVGLRLLAGHIGYETALVVLLLTPEAFLPLRNASAQFHASIEGVTAAGRVFEVIEHTPGPPAAAPAPGGQLDLRRQTILFNKVVLTYPGRTRPALSGLTLTVAPGEVVVVTGPSGAGKSSLLALLLRFAEPTAGAIELTGPELGGPGLDGPVGLAAVPAATWRDQLAWVPQRPHLFDDTVAANIALGRPGASPADIGEAARLAGADQFIGRLEAGYQTPVGERGLRLSSGQRQKLALARAFLRDAPLLLLDEPAAHLDPFSAAQVTEAIARLSAGRTVIHVTHRPPAQLPPGTRLVTLDDGHLVSPPGPVASPPATPAGRP
ncbi:MAG TPA: thiol reductant ABC exporter subunit CydD, partial [Streptosporangiaceae bacterium]|nr:thiol reductant ABC exporter subunit CydD [Streptosporangiaceae bacterium]